MSTLPEIQAAISALSSGEREALLSSRVRRWPEWAVSGDLCRR